MLLATFATDTQRNLRTFVRVAPRNAALTSDVKTGSALILGSAAVNRAAAEALGRLPSLRFRMDFASVEHAGHPIIDTATGRIIKPLWAASRKRGSRTAQAPELSRDFGLLTIARLPGTGDAKPMITINAAGIGPAGLAGAFQCLSNPEALGHIVDVALLVMSGREVVAQWLVPATANGDPVTSELVCSIAPNGRAVTQDNSRLKRESGKAPARTAAAARRRVA